MTFNNICNELDKIENSNESDILSWSVSNIFKKECKYRVDKQINLVFKKFFKDKLSEEGLMYFINNYFDFSEKELNIIINKLIAFKSINQIIRNESELLSVIITTYNRSKFLIEAVDSVLRQSYKNIEIIIMDDCSDDGTDEIIKSRYSNKKIKYYKSDKNMGPGLNRLKAFNEYAKGKYVVFMDDDDFFIDKRYFEKAVSIHEYYKNISFVAADTFVEKKENKEMELMELNLFGEIRKESYFLFFQSYEYPKPSSTFTAVFKREILDKVNMGKMQLLNDSTIYLRSILGGNPFFLDNIVGVYRIHGNNITFNCSLEFILDNLNEKIDIHTISKKLLNISDKDGDKWIIDQIDKTIFYYLRNSNPKIKDYIGLLRWIEKLEDKYKINIRKRIIKFYIRKLILG